MKRLLIPGLIIVAAIFCSARQLSPLAGDDKVPRPAVIMGLSSSISLAGTLGSVFYKNRRLR